jgi:hypothetical protein
VLLLLPPLLLSLLLLLLLASQGLLGSPCDILLRLIELRELQLLLPLLQILFTAATRHCITSLPLLLLLAS